MLLVHVLVVISFLISHSVDGAWEVQKDGKVCRSQCLKKGTSSYSCVTDLVEPW